MKIKNKKKDEDLQISTELATDFCNKNQKRIKTERDLAKRLKVSYQTYLVFSENKLFLI